VQFEQRHQEHAERQFVFQPVHVGVRVAETAFQVRGQLDGPVVARPAVRADQQVVSVGAQTLVKLLERCHDGEPDTGGRLVFRRPVRDVTQHSQCPVHVLGDRLGRLVPFRHLVHALDERCDVRGGLAALPT